MSWGYECRQKHMKQNPAQPTTPRKSRKIDPEPPGPCSYDAPGEISGNPKIKRAPAYTFGLKTQIFAGKSPTRPNAPVFNIRSMVRKGGPHKIINGVIAETLTSKPYEFSPGPAAYRRVEVQKVTLKKPPAFTMQHAAKPPYQNPDMWTPSPNMYWPPIPGKQAPAYSLRPQKPRRDDPNAPPGPGEYDPKFGYVEKGKPEYSFGIPYAPTPSKTPAPNTYCQTKFMYPLKRGPAPSFGIRHSPYIGEKSVWLKSSRTDLGTS